MPPFWLTRFRNFRYLRKIPLHIPYKYPLRQAFYYLRKIMNFGSPVFEPVIKFYPIFAENRRAAFGGSRSIRYGASRFSHLLWCCQCHAFPFWLTLSSPVHPVKRLVISPPSLSGIHVFPASRTAILVFHCEFDSQPPG